MALATRYRWPQQPIVTATKQDTYLNVGFSQPTSHTFQTKGSFLHYLELQALLRYRNPYGGMAFFKVQVEKKPGAQAWVPVHNQEFHFYTEPPAADGTWHDQRKYFTLPMKAGQTLTFRVGVSGYVGGSLPTGGGGRSPRWSATSWQVFTAQLPALTTRLVRGARRRIA